MISGAQGQDPSASGQLSDILKELREIRKILEQRPAARLPPPTRMQLNVSGLPSKGNKNASVAIIEFTGYECPFCKRFYETTYRDLDATYIKTGKIRFYVANLPSENHLNALAAAQAAECSVKQDQFWAFHDWMQSNPGKLGKDDLIATDSAIGMNASVFRECIEDATREKDVSDQAKKAGEQGAAGTPSFLVGTVSDGAITGELIVGAVPYGVFQAALDRLLPTDSPGLP